MLSNVSVNVNVETKEFEIRNMCHKKVSVTEEGNVVLTKNEKRKYVLLMNNTDVDIIVGLGQNIVDNLGITIRSGGNYQISKDYLFTGDIYAKHNLKGEDIKLDITEGE